MPIRPNALVRGFVVAAAASLAIAAPASAETLAPQGVPEKAPAPQAENQPLQLRLCHPDNPAIDYRACVNASTRNRDSKIRQA